MHLTTRPHGSNEYNNNNTVMSKLMQLFNFVCTIITSAPEQSSFPSHSSQSILLTAVLVAISSVLLIVMSTLAVTATVLIWSQKRIRERGKTIYLRVLSCATL